MVCCLPFPVDIVFFVKALLVVVFLQHRLCFNVMSDMRVLVILVLLLVTSVEVVLPVIGIPVYLVIIVIPGVIVVLAVLVRLAMFACSCVFIFVALVDLCRALSRCLTLSIASALARIRVLVLVALCPLLRLYRGGRVGVRGVCALALMRARSACSLAFR